jgi:putative tricarboxylic transport membrane protein
MEGRGLTLLLEGLMSILTFQNLLYIILATAAGLIIGALPGLTAAMGVALLVPLTFAMTPVTGLAILGAIYMSAVYGGCFSAILINTPGTPGSIATALDGYPLCAKGEGEKAIMGATYGSMVGGLFSLVALLFLSPPLAIVSLKFGPPEYFWVAIFGLTILSSMGEGTIVKTFLAGSFGLLMGCIGITKIGGELRFGFGLYQLQGGVELVAALIGLFCIPEALNFMGQGTSIYNIADIHKKKHWFSSLLREVFGFKRTMLKSSIIGTIIGILPGAGGTIANIVAYNEAKRSSKTPEKFGTGYLEGVIASETANNATVGGGLIPTLTLGVPGTPVDAIVYGALLLHGLRPGADLFTTNGKIVYGFMFALIISTLLMGVIGVAIGVSSYKAVSRIPLRFMAPAIIFLSIVGSYALRNSVIDVITMIIFGFIGYLFKQLELPPGATVLGIILGPIAEEGLVQACLMGKASGLAKVFLGNPISIVLIMIILGSLLGPYFMHMIRKGKEDKNATC